MSRTRLLVPLVLALAGCGGCSDDPLAPPAKPPQTQVATGTAGTAPAPKMTPEELFAESDKMAHGLLKSFETRVYDPRRDGLLDHAEGEIDVRIEGKDSKYRFVYDAANKPSDPVQVEALAAAPGVDKERLGRVRQWAIVACCGPFGFVAYYAPPIPLRIAPPTDPKNKNIIVWAPPFHGMLNVSYSFDELQVVARRGEWTDDKNKAVTDFVWEFWHGHYLLRRSAIVQGTALDFDYDDRQGPNLLARVRLSAGDQRGEAVFTYQTVRLRPR